MALPQFKMSDLLAAGVHFGHRTYRWNPKMAPYIFGSRNGIHIIDLQQTVPMMYQGVSILRNSVANGGRVLFVGTKTQAQTHVKEAAERCGMYYVNHRWLGGMLTNWKTISQSIKRLKEITEQFEKDEKATAHYEELMKNWKEGDAQPQNLSPLAHLTKKERLMKSRELEKLELVLGGIKDMGGLPDVVVVMDVKKDKIAVDEANCLGIPVVGIVDTNASTDRVTYPIPGNDDGARAINLYCQLFSDAVLDGIAAQAAGASSRTTATRTTATKTAKADTTVTLSPKAKEAAEAAEESAEKEAAATAEAAKEAAPAEEKAKASA